MKLFILPILVAAVVAASEQAAYGDAEHYAPANYAFGYAVHDPYSYADFGHQESRDGYQTKGSYNVLLPDGRRQVVDYYVDGPSGYQADVKYV